MSSTTGISVLGIEKAITLIVIGWLRRMHTCESKTTSGRTGGLERKWSRELEIQQGNKKHDATEYVDYDEVIIWSSEYMISQSLAQVT